MDSRALLIDFHDRCHETFARYIEHARGLPAEALDRPLDGFGYNTVRLQLQHGIGAQRYWVSVLQGAMDASEDEADAASVDALSAFRERVCEMTRAYLATEPDLAAARECEVWGGKRVPLAPVHVIERTQTHLFHHMGQLAAMYRLLDHPIPDGWDYRLV